jgi:PKD repeat protein
MKNKISMMGSLIAIAFASCVQPSPKACFDFSKTENVKVGDTITLVNCSTYFTDVAWTLPLNGTTTAVSPRIKINNSGNYAVTLTVGEDNFAKQNSLSKSIMVLP